MLTKLAIVGGLGMMVRGVLGQAAAYQQCGGQGFTGPTTCVSGYTCTEVSAPFYSQCLPGGNGGGTAATPTTPSGSTGTSSAPGTISTLVPGNSFIRGVEAPFFHFYLQSEVLGTASDAVLGDWKQAAQFQVTGGQLIQNPQGTKLYAQVAAYVSGDVKLKVTWSTTPGTFGSFVFSGDTLEWSDPSVKRSQNNAWLICADAAGHNDVYINLGPYSYNTPAGCGDQTIHAYTGATPTP